MKKNTLKHYLSVPSAHSLISKHMGCAPCPRHPKLQLQLNPPGKLIHVACGSQTFGYWHSSVSLHLLPSKDHPTREGHSQR